MAAFAATAHRDRVQLVVGPDRRLHVAAAQRVLETLVGRAHRRQVAGSEAGGRGAYGDLVHRRDHVAGVADRAQVQRS